MGASDRRDLIIAVFNEALNRVAEHGNLTATEAVHLVREHSNAVVAAVERVLGPARKYGDTFYDRH